jgi:BirA family biotin operon repressor/biotin-[acetyl-CoA-carboxylase] ligase
MKEMIARGESFPCESNWLMAGYIRAGYQTAGRGQTGNGWESGPNKNLLCSILLDMDRFHLCMPPFNINQAVCAALHKMIQSLLPDDNQLTIKWPNDIYYGDKKLAGILIENLYGGNDVKYMIAGIGLNVNQTTFVSDAPNPISIKQITGLDYDLEELMNKLLDEMNQALATSNREYYMAHLYRKDGFWPFVEREVSTAPTMNYSPSLEERDGEGLERSIFLAKIEDVRTDGELELRNKDGNLRTYHFKQIRYVL